jgi:hypothetical protein
MLVGAPDFPLGAFALVAGTLAFASAAISAWVDALIYWKGFSANCAFVSSMAWPA